MSIAASAARSYVRPRMSKAAEDPAALDAETIRNRRYYLMRRIHALTGLVPVGLFLLEHLWTNSRAIQGRTCFDHAVDEIVHLPFLPVIEVLGIFAPLAFHALYGVKLAFEAKQNVGQYGYRHNWLFMLQRVTGIITFLFILLHLKDFRIAKLLGQMNNDQFFDQLSSQLGSMRWKALVYELGVTASVFHFANGVRTFLFSWGITVSRRSQAYAAWATAGLGAALWFLGTNTVLFFATGGGTFVPSTMVRGEGGRDLCEGSLAPLIAPSPAPPATAPSGAAR
jgi:succinate dehydrogenase/fumarate reductase cytochrome b subunit (b558 family)